MRISAQTIDLVNVLRDLMDDEEANPAKALATELSKLPDFEGARLTAGYYVTPDGDIISDHWWLVMDDDSVFDVQDEPVKCSAKDPRHRHYFPFPGNKGLPVEVLTLADHLKASKRTAQNKSFTEMVNEGPRAYVMPNKGYDAEGVSQSELAAIERYADRLFQKVGIDVAFSRHFIDRVNDPRNRPNISVAELIRLFKQSFKKHGKRIPRLGPDAEAVLKDMATDVNMPFVLKYDPRDGTLDLLSKTVMRKKDFGTSDPVFSVEASGADASSDVARQSPADMPDDMTMDGREGVPVEDSDDEVRPEDMQLGWKDLIDEDDGTNIIGYHCARGPVNDIEERGRIRASLYPNELAALDSPADLWFDEILTRLGMTFPRRPDAEEDPEQHDAWARRVEALLYQKGIRQLFVAKEPWTASGGYDNCYEVHMNSSSIVAMIDDPYVESGTLILWDVRHPPSLTPYTVNEVDHPEFMPGGEEDSGHDPTYDERQTQYNPGHPRP